MFLFHPQKLSSFKRYSTLRILKSKILWRHYMAKHGRRNIYYWMTWGVNTVWYWEKVFLWKKSIKNVAWKLVLGQPWIKKVKKKRQEIGQDLKLWHLLLHNFWPVLTKAYFSTGGWVLSCVSTQFWDFPDVSLFPTILCLKSCDKSWGTRIKSIL